MLMNEANLWGGAPVAFVTSTLREILSSTSAKGAVEKLVSTLLKRISSLNANDQAHTMTNTDTATARANKRELFWLLPGFVEMYVTTRLPMQSAVAIQSTQIVDMELLDNDINSALIGGINETSSERRLRIDSAPLSSLVVGGVDESVISWFPSDRNWPCTGERSPNTNYLSVQTLTRVRLNVNRLFGYPHPPLRGWGLELRSETTSISPV